MKILSAAIAVALLAGCGPGSTATSMEAATDATQATLASTGTADTTTASTPTPSTSEDDLLASLSADARDFKAYSTPVIPGMFAYRYRTAMAVSAGFDSMDSAIEANVGYLQEERGQHNFVYEDGVLVWEWIDIGSQSWSRGEEGWFLMSDEDFWEWPMRFGPFQGYRDAAEVVEGVVADANEGSYTIETIGSTEVAGLSGVRYSVTGPEGTIEFAISHEGTLLDLFIRSPGITMSWEILSINGTIDVQPPEIGADPLARPEPNRTLDFLRDGFRLVHDATEAKGTPDLAGDDLGAGFDWSISAAEPTPYVISYLHGDDWQVLLTLDAQDVWWCMARYVGSFEVVHGSAPNPESIDSYDECAAAAG